MTKVNVAKCVGCYKKSNFKDKSIYYRSHFIYDVLDDTSGDFLGQAVFTTYDQCIVDKDYRFVVSEGKAVLVSD